MCRVFLEKVDLVYRAPYPYPYFASVWLLQEAHQRDYSHTSNMFIFYKRSFGKNNLNENENYVYD